MRSSAAVRACEIFVKSRRNAARSERKAPSRKVLMDDGLWRPRPSHSSSSAAKFSELLGESIRLRPTVSELFARPLGYLSLADNSNSFGLSIPFAARMNTFPVTRDEFLFGSK